MGKQEVLQYQTEGVCCQLIQVVVDENEKIVDADFYGGCNGNLQGIRKLIQGMPVDDVIDRLGGVKCGSKSTSCPDQLARCLLQYKQKKMVQAK